MGSQRESDPEPHQPENSIPDEEAFDGIEEEDEEGLEPDEEDGEDEEEPESVSTEGGRIRRDQVKMESLFRRLSTERVPVRVHDVIIKGNDKTKDSLIESEVVELFKKANTVQQLLRAAGIANVRLQRLDIFESVNITLDAGPPELPGTANVIVEVSEVKNPLTGDLGIFTKPEARSWSLEGSLKLKNLFGYGDIWDGSVAYGWGQASEISTGVSLPKFRAWSMPLTARISLLSQDWLKFSSYKEQALGISLGLLSSGNHDISYNLSWRTLTDPSQMSSYTVRRQLGHNLLSGLKYRFRYDKRDSPMRPTQGHAFVSTTQIGGLFPDTRSLRFIRQEFDLRYAIPFGFYRAALNFGVSGGVLFPWGSGYLNSPSCLLDRFFMGGNTSPVCSLSGPISVLGFKARGFGPAERRRVVRENSSDQTFDDSGMDYIGGDLALTAFADFSFDLPLRVLRDAGIHGHVFACTGSLSKLTENAFRQLSYQKLRDSFRSSAGFGIIVPTKLFRMEVS
ncbi:sorting and assembly machinery component 50B [Dorcoceras hygrometricum]|uniref:Sorting and assembly machinery component 50B n=1 Tax=Dorcoceras hygrometricum TaxID=472368 RepID=A0A2Z7BKU8_9LAMI|nr:sorting and assembly machinery component 50B [Dorcoceras hygrometricum]